LNDDCAYQYDKEQFVVEKVLEYVVFISFQFTSIDFIEDLQQDEHVEEN
jgi:hypothetical protein